MLVWEDKIVPIFQSDFRKQLSLLFSMLCLILMMFNLTVSNIYDP